MKRPSTLKIKYQKSNIKIKGPEISVQGSVFADPRPLNPDSYILDFFVAAAIILAVLVAVCPGQRRSRVPPLRIIQLPQPSLTGSISFEEALAKQRMARQFTGQPLKFEQIGQLAWAGQPAFGGAGGGPQASGQQQSLPPAGGVVQAVQRIYPITLYFVIQSGIYLYNPNEHSLRQTSDQDVRRALAAAATSPEAVATAGCDIILAGSTRNPAGRSTIKARGLILLQAGQIAQNIQLQTVSLQLSFMPVGDFDTKSINKICDLPRDLEPLYIISVGHPMEQIPTAGQQPSPVAAQQQTRPRTAVLIAGRENFHDRELFETMRILGAAGVQTVIASTSKGVIRGMLGGVAEARILLSQLRVDDYDAIVFVGGLGAREYFENPSALNIAREAAAKGKILAAISTAPTILANAGVLRGVRATSFLSEQPVLQQAGAVYTGAPVERHGLIITSVGPIAVVEFGGAIAEALAGR